MTKDLPLETFPLYDFPETVEAARDPAGGYFLMRGEDRYEYTFLGELIQDGLLGNCGCGRPEDFLEYLLKGLRLIDKRYDAPDGETEEQRRARYAKHQEEEKELFGSDGGKYMFYYFCDTYRLTEHGGSVPGWLDDRGRSLLKFLEAWWEEEGKPDEVPPKG